MSKYKYHAKCSQCGLGFRSNLRSDLLKRMRKHLWNKHASWMKSRIKAGLRKAKKAKASKSKILIDSAGNSLWNPSWIGFAERPLIEKVTGQKYEDVKSKVLDFFVQMLLGGITKPE